MQEIVVKTFNAVRKQIDPNHRKYSFELFGYDFILDEDFIHYDTRLRKHSDHAFARPFARILK